MTADPGGETERFFEGVYERDGDAEVPWARLAPAPGLERWLSDAAVPAGARGLVVGCGLGDDAEALAARGLRVTAFDIAPTAIARCRERFPDSSVDYCVADVLAPPSEWRAAFGVVVENRTLQSLPAEIRTTAARAIASAVAPEGRLWVRCLYGVTELDERPWPLGDGDLAHLTAAGLAELEREASELPGGEQVLTLVYGFQ